MKHSTKEPPSPYAGFSSAGTDGGQVLDATNTSSHYAQSAPAYTTEHERDHSQRIRLSNPGETSPPPSGLLPNYRNPVDVNSSPAPSTRSATRVENTIQQYSKESNIKNAERPVYKDWAYGYSAIPNLIDLPHIKELQESQEKNAAECERIGKVEEKLKMVCADVIRVFRSASV